MESRPVNRRDSREPGGVATMPVADRQPPYAPEAEISVLGGMLIDGNAVSKAVEIVDDSMFYREANRRIFRAMARLFQQGQVVDPVTVSEELKQSDELEARSEEHTSELQSRPHLVCRLLPEKKKNQKDILSSPI